MRKEVYLDNSATTKVLKEVAEEVYKAMLEDYGNPSSLHNKGLTAERTLKEARRVISKFLGVEEKEIYFTSGGTESNNIAIKGAAKTKNRKGKHIITTCVEHPSVLEVCGELEKEGFNVTYLPVGEDGIVRVSDVINAVKEDTVLISVMHVNNEVGSIQPVEEIAEFIKDREIVFHVDAVQSFGKINLPMGLKGISLLSLSAHKVYGPKGVGALFKREDLKIEPLVNGGGQERGLRSGTENVPGIRGFCKAVEILEKNFSIWTKIMKNGKERLKRGIIDLIEDVVINTPAEKSAPHILNVSFLGVKAEVLLHALENHGIFVSTGSACSSHKKIKSHVLVAMGKKEEEVESAVRFSLSPFITEDDIDYTLEILKTQVKELRRFKRR
ncbi:cysteine desulfurase family protein [Thermovenabulum sp.]|uniref:cysteine desulfurase family protein n=1 Tax=Thermovenabulum sp. TaxID=3100335 RepID=UPI003C7C85BA